MNKIALSTSAFIFLSFVLLLTHNPFQARTKTDPEPFHMQGQLSESVQNIFQLLGQNIQTLEEANKFAQKNLLRAAGSERWDKQQEQSVHQLMQENRSSLGESLQELGMIDEIHPPKKHYTYAGLLGTLKERMEYRMGYLHELIENGYTFDYIVLLAGARPLQEKEKENLPEDIKTECEMAVYLFNNSPLKDKKVIVVDAPMIQKDDGTVVRPITDDTYVYFEQIAPQDGSFLVVSNNPYVIRQTLVAQRILDKKRFPVDGAGKKADAQEMDIIMACDEFARTLYEEYKQFSSHN